MENKIIVAFLVATVLVGLSPVTATPSTNQSITATFSVPQYIGISVNNPTVDFGNVTPGLAVPTQTRTLTDDSNVNIGVWARLSTPLTSGSTVLDQSILKTSLDSDALTAFSNSSDVQLTSKWTASGSEQNKTQNFGLSIPYSTLPGSYAGTIYEYAQAV